VEQIGNLSSALSAYKDSLKKPENALELLNAGIAFIALWNPILSAILGALTSSLKIGINENSSNKIYERLDLIIQTIEKIIIKQKEGKTNYEAALICPELFRNALIFEDIDRVKEYLLFIELLFSAGKMDFDDIVEALKLVNQLSSIEYKILKLIPKNKTKWKEILAISEVNILYKERNGNLKSAILSLINMNLIVRKLAIRHDGGPEIGNLDFNNDSEYIKLSEYGILFLKTMESIKK